MPRPHSPSQRAQLLSPAGCVFTVVYGEKFSLPCSVEKQIAEVDGRDPSFGKITYITVHTPTRRGENVAADTKMFLWLLMEAEISGAFFAYVFSFFDLEHVVTYNKKKSH